MKEALAPGPALEPPALGLTPAAATAVPGVLAPDAGIDVPASLPRDHPNWQRDALAVSARARAIVARLRPITVRVLTFWDHVVRTIAVRGRRLEVDPSGCYRIR